MKKGFTLLELIITLLVVFILVTVGGVSYRLVLEKARARVDETNKQTILRAIKVASLEAGVLGELDNEWYLQHIGNAYTEVMKESGWWTKFSYFFVRLNTPRDVYADVGKYVDPQYMKKYGVDPQVFISPSDKNGPPSYGINARLEGKKWDEIEAGTIVIGDCDNPAGTFVLLSELSARHYTTLESLVSNSPKIQAILLVGRVLEEDGKDMRVLVTAIGDCISNCGSDKECKKNCALHVEVDEAETQLEELPEETDDGIEAEGADYGDVCKSKPSKGECDECCEVRCKNGGSNCEPKCKEKCKGKK